MFLTGKLKDICFYNRVLFLLALDPACENSGKSIFVESISLKYPRIPFPDAGKTQVSKSWTRPGSYDICILANFDHYFEISMMLSKLLRFYFFIRLATHEATR